MGTGNGSSNEQEITLRVPEGMDPRAAKMFFEQLMHEMHDLEPLATPASIARVAQALLGDYPMLAKLRKAISEAPSGARWGIGLVEQNSLLMPGQKPTGFYLDAFCKMRDAKAHSFESVIKTSNCLALITSATARGALSMHGYALKITAPFVPADGEDLDAGDEGARG